MLEEDSFDLAEEERIILNKDNRNDLTEEEELKCNLVMHHDVEEDNKKKSIDDNINMLRMKIEENFLKEID